MSGALPTVCILAGGLGTRLGEQVADTPKPLLEIAGEPFLLHQLRLLADHGAERAVICVGYLGDQIERRIGVRQFGIAIEYSYDGPMLIGTLGAVRKAADRLSERFLVLYGDTYLRLDYRAACDAWQASGLPAMMTVLRNEGQWDTSNVEFDGQRLVAYSKRHPTPEMGWIDYGLGGIARAALDHVGCDVTDLADLYQKLAAQQALFGYPVNDRFYEIGTPAALAEADAFLRGPGA